MRKNNFWLILAMVFLYTTNSYSFCSCWDGLKWPANTADLNDTSGSHCGAGLEADSGYLHLPHCQTWCEKNTDTSIYNTSYVDQPAFNKCKTQNPSKVRAPTPGEVEALTKRKEGGML